MADALPWRAGPTGVRLAVRVTPNAHADALGGIEHLADGAPVLVLRVRVPPLDGRANAAAIALLSRALGVSRSAIRIASGETGRRKLLDITGESADILARLSRLVADAGDAPTPRA